MIQKYPIALFIQQQSFNISPPLFYKHMHPTTLPYYIQSMNAIVMNEEETRTIKYLNNSRQMEDGHSESLTEKQNEAQAGRGKHSKRSSQHSSLQNKSGNGKVSTPDSQEMQGNGKELSRNLANPIKSKHKKGKSMDMEELKALSKQEQRYYLDGTEAEIHGKVVINCDFLNNFRERGSISQMKQYQISKKLPTKKPKEESSPFVKKKKSKTSNQGEIKQIKKENKAILDAGTLLLNFKKREGSNKSSKTSRSNNSNYHFGKHGHKHGSKSHEIATDRKRVQHKIKLGSAELKNIGFSLPMTSKMVSLYSNNSSLFNSKSQLQKNNKMQSYIIPTEQSIQEIVEIRKFQSLTLRKRSSDNIRKISLINQLQDSDNDHKQSTENIITHFLNRINSEQMEFYRNNQLEISQIPHQNSTKERNEEISSEVMLGSLNFAELHQITQNNHVVLEKSVIEHQLSHEISHQEKEISKLNQIIEIIQQKEKSESLNKEEILKQIKSLITKNYQQQKKEPNLPQIQEEHEKLQSKNDLSSSQLKESLNFQESMEGLNLQILDKTLREREKYLTEKKQKELQRLQQHKSEGWEKQMAKIEKWMNHQIKEVVHIRKQLWKGFNIAKNILVSESPKKEGKKNEMIKCLSDKYLAKTHRTPKKESSQELTKARVNELQAHNQLKEQEQISEIDININPNSQDESDEQLLDNQAKLKNEFILYREKLLRNENRVDFEGDMSSESSGHSSKPLNDSPKLLEPPSIGIPASGGGLNLQRIECEIQYEDSLNSQQMEALARQSETVKQQSMKMPFQLSIQDKQDIYEFIFLDLCIELTDEYPPNSTVMKKISAFIKNMKEQAKKQKGFKTNTNAIRDYLFQFITYLKNKPDQLAEVHLNMDKPLGPTAIDILKYMHISDEDPMQDDASDTVFILDIKLFETFEQTFLNSLEFQKYYDDEQKEKKRKTFLRNAIHIHNKAIFDALNETLDRQRPFGVWGEPFSWKKAAKFYHTRDVAIKNSLILKSAQKTIQFGAYMCGFIIDKQDCNLKNNPNVTQAYIDQIRDDRLSRLLANQLDQGQEKMLFIDDEQTEILVQVSQSLLQNLLNELCRELLQL